MFTLAKLLSPLFLPPVFLFLILLVAVGIWKWRTKAARILVCAALILYYVFSIEPTTYFLEASLTNFIPEDVVQDLEGFHPDCIVVLGGGAEAKDDVRPMAELGGASWRRLWHAFDLYWKLGGEIPIMYSGGSGDPFVQKSHEAELARSYALAVGIPEDMFITESFSRDTFENGTAVEDYLRLNDLDDEHGIILVTSATHMPRAVRVMQGLGLEVFPSAADYGLTSLQLDPLSFYPSDEWFSRSTRVLHEWVGMIWYRLNGRIL